MNENCCAICFEEFKDKNLYVLENCNHLYHYDCIKRYVETVLSTEKLIYCPLCRTVFRTIGFERTNLNIILDSASFNLPRECLIYENLTISKKMCEFMNLPYNCLSNRFNILKKIYKYIDDNGLKCNNEIMCDKVLKELFNIECREKNTITYRDIQMYITEHIG